MDGFSYTDIFETKGIEYLVIIAFLILIIPFWHILNRKRRIGEIAASIDSISGFRIPMGIFLQESYMGIS